MREVKDLSKTETDALNPPIGGCEYEPPPGYYCSREFHHNGPCANHLLPGEPVVEDLYLKGIMDRQPSALATRFWAEPADPRTVKSIGRQVYTTYTYSDGTATVSACYKKNPDYPELTIMGDGTLQNPFTIVKIGSQNG